MLSLLEQLDRTDPYTAHAWWIFDARQTSPKTCPVCQSLNGSHYRGDELASAFPRHMRVSVNKIRALVHPHCRCRLIWTGYTRRVTENPYGVLKRAARKIGNPQIKLKLSPSQKVAFGHIARYSRETWKKTK